MTYQEALKHFKSLQKRYTTEHNGVMCAKVECAIEALEKQIGKKPIDDSYFYGDIYICPICSCKVEKFGDIFNYCCSCGQKIDWSKE